MKHDLLDRFRGGERAGREQQRIAGVGAGNVRGLHLEALSEPGSGVGTR
jgi:hypothetical protein